jgi:hypothetical protein
VQYYQVWHDGSNGSQLLGVYDIPAATANITLAGRRVTDTNLAAQYVFASKAEVDALTAAVAAATTGQLYPALTAGKHVYWNGSTFANASISEAGGTVTVTGNQAVTGNQTIAGNQSVTGTMTATGGYSGITAGNVPALDASKITSGTLSAARVPAVTDDKLPATMTGKTLINPVLQNPTVQGDVAAGDVTATGDLLVGGVITGNGSGITGLTGATGGVANTGSTTVGADTDVNGSGVLDLQTRLLTGLRIENDQTVNLTGGLTSYARASLPAPGKPGRLARVSDDLRGLWYDTGSGWSSVSGFADVRDFAASGSTATYTCAATAASLTVTCTTATDYQAGQTILIPGAGAAGAAYYGTVSSAAGTVLTLTGTPPATTVASATVQHDDTAAVQAAVNAASARGGAKVRAPAGVYNVLGPMKTTVTGALCQVCWPRRSQADAAATVEIVGEGAAPAFDSTIGGLTVFTGGTIFKSNATSGSVFGGDGDIAAVHQTAVKVVLRDLTVRVPDNPATIAIDVYYAAWAQLDNVRADTGMRTDLITQPTHVTGVGIRMPMRGNGNQSRLSGVVSVSGFYYGIYFGEHDTFDKLIVFGSKYAALFTGSDFPTVGSYFVYANCQQGLLFTTAAQQVQIDVMAAEHYNPAGGVTMPAWMETVTDVSDASNLARGRVGHYVVKGYVGYDTTFTQSGAFFLKTPRIRDEAFSDTIAGRDSDQTIPHDTPTTLNFNVTVEDFNAAHSAVTNNSRITPPKYGTVTLLATVQFAANATGSRSVSIWKSVGGGGGNYQIAAVNVPAAATTATVVNVAAVTTAASPGDHYYVEVYQNSGVSLAVTKTTSPAVYSPVFQMRY